MKGSESLGSPSYVLFVMGSKRALERQLAVFEGFDSPDASLEQYPTSAGLAAEVIHRADLDGAIKDKVVIDLGSGTGILAAGAALRGASRVIGVELDPTAIAIAKANLSTLKNTAGVDWIHGAVSALPVCTTGATVIMNPPFGAQHENTNADRVFLLSAKELGGVSYSIHNTGSREFMESFVTDHDGVITHAYSGQVRLTRQFTFHAEENVNQDVEVYRVEWPET